MLLQKLQQFLYGRYGSDKLSLFLLVVGLLFSLLGRLFFWPLFLIADVLYFYALFRILSRNIPARQREYSAFLKVWNPIEGWLRLQKRKWKERGQYKYFKCPSCRQRLRAPRGRGKIQVTCQRCKTVFLKKT